MSAPTSDHKKRPPPIAIPQWPQPLPVTNAFANAPSHTKGSGQHPQRFASSSTQQAVHSSTTTPLTSPLELDESRLALPKSGSQASKHRSSAMTTLSTLMDQARGSPRKSDGGSARSRHGSTARSRQSERSHPSATAAQARLEALDETTTRSQIESHTEKKLFKMTGQIPPTPTTGAIDPDKVFIRTEDLRAQCRAASGEKQSEGDEPTRSPKKKLFGVSLPTFSKTSAPSTTPAMPSKAAQVLGTAPARKPRRIELRPIKPSHVLKTPTKDSRSESVRHLPAKVYGHANPARSYYSTSARRTRTPGRRSPGKENTPPQDKAAVNLSFESMPPPTPPAKDTPPEFRLPMNPPSPLRRAPSHDDLRESYGGLPDRDLKVQLQFPVFALSPLPPKTAIHGSGSGSPTKFRPYTAEDYTKLIEGEALQWPYIVDDEVSEVKEGGHSAPLVTESHELLQLPLSSRSDDNHYNERLGRRLSPLPPRFYSPSNRSVQLFKDGESPSQNTDTSRMLFAPPNSLHVSEDSNNGSIEMVYQGSMNAIDADSVKAQSTNTDDAQTQDRQVLQQRDGAVLAARVKQEVRIGEQHQLSALPNDGAGHLQPEISSSKLTDMLDGATPRIDSNGDFRMLCPSAVPSPLHKLNGPQVPMPPTARGGIGAAPVGLWPSPRPHKTIEDHFFMTNEHLDVVGKTTYDALDMYSKQQIGAINAKHEQLMVTMENHIEGLKSQINSINEKADANSDHTRNFSLKLDQLEQFLKEDAVNTVTAQTKKTAELDSNLREMQKAILHMQQTLERLSEPKSGLHHSADNALPALGTSTQLPNTVPTQHSQPALTDYYGNETGRDELPPMPPLQDRTISNNYESHGGPRGTWQSQVWNGRSTYHGRNKGETSSYAGTNPYHFGNGGQYNNGYMNSYSSYNFSPTSPEQPYAYGQRPAQG